VPLLKARVQRLVAQAQKTLPAQVLMAYGQSRASNYALALAFAGFMSMFPMMLGALAILGFAIRDPATQAHFQALMLQVFPLSAQPELQKALSGVKQSAGWLGLLSLAGLLWGASSIFGTMEFALTEIFGTKQRDMLRQRLMGLVMMLILVVAIVVIVGINSLVAFIPLAGWITWTIGLLAGALVMVALLCALYRFVPNRTFQFRDVLPGAILAGVLIELLSLAFPLYARVAGSFNTYGAQFGLFFLLATWFYLLSQVVLLGAVYNRFRLGEPVKWGIIASPEHGSREKGKPVVAIEQKKAENAPPELPRRSVFQRVALAVVVGLAITAGALRRKRPKTAN
jgi:membrane protein